MNPPALTERQRFGLAIDCGWEVGARRSPDWLAGGPPGSGCDGFAHRLLMDEGADHPKVLAARLQWLDAEGHRARGSNLAYDRLLLVYHARNGAAVEWLTPDEAWGWIDKAVTALLGRYKNWGDFAVGLIEGYEAAQGRALPGARSFLTQALESERSVWNRTPWPGAVFDDTGLELDLAPRTFKPG